MKEYVSTKTTQKLLWVLFNLGFMALNRARHTDLLMNAYNYEPILLKFII